MLIALLIMSLAGAGLIGSIITTADIELLSQRVETVISNPEHAAASQQILAEVKTEMRISRTTAAFHPSRQKISGWIRLNHLSARPFYGCTCWISS